MVQTLTDCSKLSVKLMVAPQFRWNQEPWQTQNNCVALSRACAPGVSALTLPSLDPEGI